MRHVAVLVAVISLFGFGGCSRQPDYAPEPHPPSTARTPDRIMSVPDNKPSEASGAQKLSLAERQRAEREASKKRFEDSRLVSNAMEDIKSIVRLAQVADGRMPTGREIATQARQGQYRHLAAALSQDLIVIVGFPDADGLWAYPKDWKSQPLMFAALIGGGVQFLSHEEFEKRFVNR